MFLGDTERCTNLVPVALTLQHCTNQEQSAVWLDLGQMDLREQPSRTLRAESETPVLIHSVTSFFWGLKLGHLSTLVSTAVKMGLIIPACNLIERGQLMNTCKEL